MANYFDEMGWTPLNDGQVPDHFAHIQRLLRDFNIFDGNTTNSLPPPASKKAVAELKTQTIAPGDDKQCTICLKTFEVKESAVQMPCEHLFHSECINLWLTKTNSCPLCRYELPTDDEDYEAYRKEKIRAKQREQELEVLHDSMFS